MITKAQAIELMTDFDVEEIDQIIENREDCLGAISSLSSAPKTYYENLIHKIDGLFNQHSVDMTSDIERMMEDLLAKSAGAPIQLISFRLIESGDYSVRLAAYEKVDPKDHAQTEGSISGDVSNMHLRDLNEVRSDILDSDFYQENEDALESFWFFPFQKKLTQFKLSIGMALSEFEFSRLNVTYPLYVYIDFEGEDAGTGMLIGEVNAD